MSITQTGFSSLLAMLLSLDAGAWPHPWALRVYSPLAWAVVLSAVVLWSLRARAWRWRAAAAVGVFACTVAPGPVSPAYWLGLAFQAPSLMALALAGCAVWSWLQPDFALVGGGPLPRLPWMLAAAAALLGACLLMDTLAWLPLELYRWGGAALTAWLLLLIAALTWALAPPSASARVWAGLIFAVVAVYVVTRLPSGNLWDALLDPWLWLLAVIWLVRAALEARRVRRANA